MQRTLLVTAAALLAAPLAAQNPRPSVQLDTTGAGVPVGPSVDSEGDCSAVGWKDLGDESIYISVSDGCGINWSPPLRADTVPATKFIVAGESVKVCGDQVFVAWSDDRFDDPVTLDIESVIVVNVYNCITGTFSGEVVVPKQLGPGLSDVTDYRISVVSPPTGPATVYVLMAEEDPVSGFESLVLAVSQDRGVTFPIVTPIVPIGSFFDVDAIDLDSALGTVEIAWEDDRNGAGFDDVFHVSSSDRGVTISGITQLDASGPVNGDADNDIHVEVAGGKCVVAWQEEAGATGPEEVHANVSVGGVFQGDVLIGNYTPGVHDVDAAVAGITPSGNIVVAWDDDRTGTDEIYVAVSKDCGLTYTEVGQLSSGGGGFPVVIPYEKVQKDGVCVLWTGQPFPNIVESAYSNDGGCNYEPTIRVDDNSPGDADFAFGAFNDCYQNFVMTWISDPTGTNALYAGGYRAQTITPNGVVAGPTVANFDFEHFDGRCPQAWALLSLSPGFLPLPGSGKDLKIAPDPLFFTSVNLAIQGILSANIGPDRSGSTPPVPTTFPPGLTLFAVGLGVNLGTLSFCSITDVEVIVL